MTNVISIRILPGKRIKRLEGARLVHE